MIMFSFGFMTGVVFMVVLSVVDATLLRRAEKKRFDDEVDRIMARQARTRELIERNRQLLKDLTYRS